MRAVVLLCLLGSALVDARSYTWGPVGGLEDVCLQDTSLCGCCLMQQRIHRMEASFNTSLTELQKELKRSMDALQNVRASRSAFSVALNDLQDWKCLGPFDEEKVITYKDVFLNLGDSYDVDTGVFTVPRSGVYSLALTVYSNAGHHGYKLAACANLMVNGVVVAGPREQNREDQEDSASVVMAIQLNAGDQVSVHLPAGCFLCDSKKHYNTFTGYLLYASA